MKLIAVGRGIKDALFADVQGAAVGFVNLLVRILFKQLAQQRWEVPVVAARGAEFSRRAFCGPLLEALIPINLEGRHIRSGRNVVPYPAPHRIPLITAAADFLRFDAGWMLDL